MAGSEAKLQLERVLGCTTLSNSCFASCPNGDIYYASGAVAVRYNPHTNKQLAFFHASKPISCLCVSSDGRLLAVGERGHQPGVLVWDTDTSTPLATLSGHRQGVGCLAFSPDSQHLVSVGFRHDRQLILWDWAAARVVTTHRLSNKVNACCWSDAGAFFVTCGDRHLKFWALEYDGENPVVPTGLSGKPGSITEQLRDAVFMDVCCGATGTTSAGLVYCTTSSGVLCAFTEQRLMDKWVQLESPASYCLALFCKPGIAGLLVVGCADGIARTFSPETLAYQATLPLPCALSQTAVTLAYPAAYALRPVAGNPQSPVPKLAAIYADHSLVVWDLTDIHCVAQYRSFLAHRACIWDVQFIDRPDPQPTPLPNALPHGANQPPAKRGLPAGSFATSSADGTIRIWNLDPKQQQRSKWRSPYCRELLHVIELDDGEAPRAGAAGVRGSVGSSLQTISSLGACSAGSADNKEPHARPDLVDLSHGLPDPELPGRPVEAVNPRALAVHPSGEQLCCGDQTGRLRLYDLATMTLAHSTVAHAAEILALHYSPPLVQARAGGWAVQVAGDGEHTSTDDAPAAEPLVLLASAGRDRLIHVFSALSSALRPLSTLDHHSSSITLLRFTSDGKRLISCGGDRTMAFCSVNGPHVERVRSVQTPHGTINGLAVEATNKFCVTAGQDRRLNIWNLQSGKRLRAYRNAEVTHELYRADIDPSGMFVAASAFDKHVYLFDFFSGELLTRVGGHSELVTSVRFSLDGRRVVSVGGDGCVMVWRLHDGLVRAMQDR